MGVYDNNDFLMKKEEVKNAYPSYSWEWKVDHMKPNQILAIWKSLNDRKNKKPKRDGQLSLFDLYPNAMLVR